MEWRNRNVGALKAPLEQTSEILQTVCVDIPFDVAPGMIDYQQRCLLVYEGDTTQLSKVHLQFADFLLFNLLVNLARFPDRFPNKRHVIEFAELLHTRNEIKGKPEPDTSGFFAAGLDQFAEESFPIPSHEQEK